jgi:hypothetical protein
LEKAGIRVGTSRFAGNGGHGTNPVGLGGSTEVKLSFGDLVLLLERWDVWHLVSVGFIESGLQRLLMETVRVSLVAVRAHIRISLAGFALDFGQLTGLDTKIKTNDK